MGRHKRATIVAAGMLSLALMVWSGCQQSPQHVPARETPFRTADEAEMEKPRPWSSDASTPELPQDLTEMEEASRMAEASGGTAPEVAVHPAAQELEEAAARDRAEKPATRSAPQEPLAAPGERPESLIREDSGSDASGSPTDGSTQARAEGKSGPGQPTAAEETNLPSDSTEQPADSGKGDGASGVRDKTGSVETPQGLEGDQAREADSPRQPQEPEPSVEEEPASIVPAPDPGPAGNERSEGAPEPAGGSAQDAEAGASSPPQLEPGAAPRRSSAVALAEIPGLPTPPPADTRARPKGVVQAPKGKPGKPAEVCGRWRQTGQNNNPDFLPGGYESSILVFRPEGILEVQRTFGKDGAILQTWQVGYMWNRKKSVLTLGREPELRPPPQSLKGFEAGDVVVQSAVRTFPVALPCVRADDGTIRLGKKAYVSMKEAGKNRASDEDEREKKNLPPGRSSKPD